MAGKNKFSQLYILCLSSNCARGEITVWNIHIYTNSKVLLGIVMQIKTDNKFY